MANLQIKGMDDNLYAELSRVATAENRSISQQVLFLIKGHLARHKSIRDIPTPADTLLAISGSWDDDRPASEIIGSIRKARKNAVKLDPGF